MTRWADYDIRDEIGRGGFGTVYRAFHPTLAREVALKLIPVPSGQPREIDKALDEARRLAKVQHENVVLVHDARFADGYVGICMELIQGQSLAHIVDQQGRFGADETITLGLTLCRALRAVHRQGVIHSDIKAQNVMRTDLGRYVLMDFGAGHHLREPDRTTQLQIIGTPTYMAPELFRFRDATFTSDVYSLGVLLFFVLTKTFPIDRGRLEDFAVAHARHERTFLGDLRDDLPGGLVGVIEKALAPRRRDRYRTPGQMLADLSSPDVRRLVRHKLQAVTTQAPAHQVVTPSETTGPPLDQASATAAWPRSITTATIAATIVAAAVSAIWLLGFLASKAYDVMFGLTGDFAGGAPIAWLELGFHTLPLPAYCMLVSLIALLTLRFAVRVVVRIIPGATTWVGATTERLEALSVKAGLGDGVTLGSALLVGQMAVIALTYWYFQDFINAFTTPVIESTRALCAQLASPNENVRLLYFCVTSVLALAGGAAWTLLMRRNVQGAGATSAIALAGLALTALCTGMFAIPWPIVYRSTFRTGSIRR